MIFTCRCGRSMRFKKPPARVSCSCGLLTVSPQMAEDPPHILELAARYMDDVTRWTLAGCPIRSDAQIAELLDICQACPHFRDHHCQHSNCGCKVLSPAEEKQTLLGRLVSGALVNALRMATKKCPAEKF